MLSIGYLYDPDLLVDFHERWTKHCKVVLNVGTVVTSYISERNYYQ